MRIVIACRRCGHERLVTRASIVKGDWRKQRCPVCNWTETDDSTDEREPVTAA